MSVQGALKGVNTLRREIDTHGIIHGIRRWQRLARLRYSHEFDGMSIFERDWDICIILDACRHDELARLTGEYGFLDDCQSVTSVASSTSGWLPRTFESPSLPDGKIGYITANTITEEFLDDSSIDYLDEIWRYAWNDEFLTVLPETVTARAVQTSRNESFDRLIVHYLQPHTPFINTKDSKLSPQVSHDSSDEGDTVWDRVRRGELQVDRAIRGYRTTLRQVLDSINVLMDNIDAEKVVITADHGEAFGEHGIYEHPENLPIPALTSVPWVETSAVDRQTYDPDPIDRSTTDTTVDKQLKALGYR